MCAEEISYLKSEIARLNQIITVLLEQNAFIKQQNAYLNIGLGNQQQRNSDVKTVVGIPEKTDSYAKIDVGNGKNANSEVEIGVGNPEVEDSNANIVVGNQNIANSYHKTEVGNQLMGDSYVKTVLGIPQATDSHPKTTVGNPTVAKPLPETWTLDEVSIRRISARLREAGFRNVNNKGKGNIAKVLVHFHNKGKGGFKELHKVTGLSEGGVGKLMMSLQKRGTIHRTAYQHYALGAGALQVLQKAYNDDDRFWLSTLKRKPKSRRY